MISKDDVSAVDSFLKDSGIVEILEPWNRIKRAIEELAQQTHNRSSVPCGDCGKLLMSNMECDNPECVRGHSTR